MKDRDEDFNPQNINDFSNLNFSHFFPPFSKLHIGIDSSSKNLMLKSLRLKSFDDLIKKVFPDSLSEKMNSWNTLQVFNTPLSEEAFLTKALKIAKKNKLFKSYIGMGYSAYQMPYVIQRNILENPKWYTSYTPYQSEISQGRLQALLNFQTLITDLTQMEISNASLLDESSASAEAMVMAYNIQTRKNPSSLFFISEDSFPQNIEVLKTRAGPLGIEIEIGDPEKIDFSKKKYFACFLQYPSASGKLYDLSFYQNFSKKLKEGKSLLIVAANLLSLPLLSAPGEWGADIVVGNANLGLPLNFGGPHAAYISTLNIYKRHLPGRIVGVSKDREGMEALRLSLQTREQHIRRERATSNICTAQALPAILTSFYAVFKGRKGLIEIAKRVHAYTSAFYLFLKKIGLKTIHSSFFDTLCISFEPGKSLKEMNGLANQQGVLEPKKKNVKNLGNQKEILLKKLIEKKILVYSAREGQIQISMDETVTDEDFHQLIEVFKTVFHSKKGTSVYEGLNEENLDEAKKVQKKPNDFNFSKNSIFKTFIPENLIRKTPFLTHPVFNSYHSETEILRYITQLESKDLSLAHSMIPLGSCTMKLNATSEMIPVTWKEFSNLHPFSPLECSKGFREMIDELSTWLCHLTGFSKISFQPNAGSQGEYSGLLAIKKYYEARGETQRNLCLIPSSAHGTNPASAAMAGFDILVVRCDSDGNIDVQDLQKKVEKHASKIGVLMVTYPSTHGVFEEGILDICEMMHSKGAQVYLDGANFNALVGLLKLSSLGADLAHLNLHKTFCIPHGGGGPGVGPLCVAKHLESFLPSHNWIFNLDSYKEGIKEPKSLKNPPLIKEKMEALNQDPFVIASSPYGNANVLPVTWGYLSMMGLKGLKEASLTAILNANYVAWKLNPYFPILYKGKNDFVAHECILDLRSFKETAGVTVEDVAKRLLDYGFHAPTMSWPVSGTLMVEPTESESLKEIDRFCDAMISIREEIQAIEKGTVDRKNNVLKNAPHSIFSICKEKWDHPYSREEAAFPKPWLKKNKFWPSVSRVDNVYGDKNLMCLCPSLKE